MSVALLYGKLKYDFGNFFKRVSDGANPVATAVVKQVHGESIASDGDSQPP
jgi:hypothetical protein